VFGLKDGHDADNTIEGDILLWTLLSTSKRSLWMRDVGVVSIISCVLGVI